jgi:hypothetical protein
MKTLKQNNLESGTTELGFVKAMNENIGEGTVKLIREVELDNGEKVSVEGITPHGMKKALNMVAGQSNMEVTFITPGEDYDINGTGENTEPGLIRTYNAGVANLTPDTTNLDDEPENDNENPDGE